MKVVVVSSDVKEEVSVPLNDLAVFEEELILQDPNMICLLATHFLYEKPTLNFNSYNPTN